MAEKPTYRTPKGAAYWSFLTEPDTQFDEKGKYRIELVVDPNVEEDKKLLSFLKDQAGEGKVPYKKHKDPDSGEETGEYAVSFKSAYRPSLFDASGSKIDSEDMKVGNGSIVKVAYQPNLYDGFGGGLNLYLKAVQIFELVEWKGGTKDDFGFESEAGFTVEENEETMPDATPNDPDVEPDDLF